MAMARTPAYWTNKKSAIRAHGFSGVSLLGSSRLWRSLSRLPRFPSALKLLENRQATQANIRGRSYPDWNNKNRF